MNLLHFKIIAGVALLSFASLLSLVFEESTGSSTPGCSSGLGRPCSSPFSTYSNSLARRNIVPRRAIPWAFNGAPWVSAAAALMILLYVPMGSPPILSGSGDLILILYLLGFPPLPWR